MAGPSTAGPVTPPGSGTPKPKPAPVLRAADGVNYKACSDARCEVAVQTGTRLPVKKSALGFTDVLVVSRVSNGSVDYGAKGGCCSISTKAQKPGGTYTLNSLKVRTVAVSGKFAVLRLSPPEVSAVSASIESAERWKGFRMAVITVRNLDDHVKQRLRVRAARNGRSMEAEARAILVDAVGAENAPKNMLMRLHEAAAELGGVELDIPPREGTIRVVEFGE